MYAQVNKQERNKGVFDIEDEQKAEGECVNSKPEVKTKPTNKSGMTSDKSKHGGDVDGELVYENTKNVANVGGLYSEAGEIKDITLYDDRYRYRTGAEDEYSNTAEMNISNDELVMVDNELYETST